MEARARTLLAHADAGYEEWGVSGAVRLSADATGRGLSLSLAPTWGTPSSGVERLWGARAMRGASRRAVGGEARRGLRGELGYGVAAFRGGYTGTPHVGFGHSDAARDYLSVTAYMEPFRVRLNGATRCSP